MQNIDIRLGDVIEITSRLHSKGVGSTKLRRVLIDIVPGIGGRYESLILFLDRINFLTIQENIVHLNSSEPLNDIVNEVCNLALSCADIANEFSINCNGVELINMDSKRVSVDSSRTSYTFLWFILFLSEFGILTRNHKNLYSVSQEWQYKFFDFLYLCSDPSSGDNKVSPEMLKKIIDHKLSVGYQAELFVLEYEKIRLKSHPFVDSIEHVALVDTAAGYDILSFDSETELLKKRFIEVKSWSKNREFFFSRNEFDTAAKKGKSYCIYFVNRSLMKNSQYHPELFFDPVESIFNNESHWAVISDGYKISEKSIK